MTSVIIYSVVFFQCNRDYIKCKNKLYQDTCIHKVWCNFKELNDLSFKGIQNEIMWENRYITAQEKCFIWK